MGFTPWLLKDFAPIRERISEQPTAFDQAAESSTRAGYALPEDDLLTAMPQGYSQHVGASFTKYLKLKSLIVRKDPPKTLWTSGSVVDEVTKLTEACATLIAAGRSACERDLRY